MATIAASLKTGQPSAQHRFPESCRGRRHDGLRGTRSRPSQGGACEAGGTAPLPHRRDEAAPKPDPEGILVLLAAWNATPESTVMVGDFRYELEAGRRAGVATIYYDDQQQDLWTAAADFRVRSHTELLTLIRADQPGLPDAAPLI